MKKITLALSVFVLLLGTTMTKASSEKVFDDVNERFHPVDYRYAEPIVFMERGIEFMIFPNGEFDFNTVATNAGPRPINTTYGAPMGNAYGYWKNNRNRGIRVEHDYRGRVRRVGNVYINYDAFGRVKRVGSVYMRYNSFALSRVGNLRIIYDRRGRIVDIRGFVNAANHGYNYAPVNNHYSATTVYYGNSNGYDSGYGYNDNDFYYYKADGTKAKMSKEDVDEIKKEERELSKDKSKR